MDDERATVADVTIEFVPADRRAHPKDSYRVSHGGGAWACTSPEVWLFLGDLEELLRRHHDAKDDR